MMPRVVVTVLLLTVAWPAFAQDKRYAAPRTPWGHPDLQGVWTSDDARTVPLQRPPELGDRRMLTDEEFAARKQRDDETRGDVKLAAGTFVGEVGTRSLRHTSLVVSPANGRVPARTPAADQRMAALAKGVNPLLPRSWEDRSLFERCISRGYLGYSTGRWDGDTLLIESSGFTDRTAIAGTRHSEKLKVVERLTRVSDDTVSYEATVSDSETWTAPFTVVVPLSTQPGYDVFPYECHEGNNALRNMLSAARAEEKVIDEYVKKGLPPPPLARPGDADILPQDPSFGRRR